MEWRAFNATGRFVSKQTLTMVDPYLAWAEATDFVHQRRATDQQLATVDVLIELCSGRTAAELQTALGAEGTVRPAYFGHPEARFCVAELSSAACLQAFAPPLNKFICRFEYAAPMLPQRPPPRPFRVADGPTVRARRTIQQEGKKLLVGVIDFGCPFASAQFRDVVSSRLLNIWDQDPNPAFGGLPAVGGVPTEFGYGREVSRDMINALLAACTRPGSNSVDEDACYELARYPELRRRATHGAHVMDLLAGPNRRPGRMPRWPDEPPLKSPGEALDDIVFVQLPRDTWSDPTGNALAASVLDGLRYILSCAGPSTSKVVVNISCALYTGPGNGTSLMEAALKDLVDLVHEQKPKRSLLIYLPTGNSFDARVHAEGTIRGGQTNDVVIRVPPDNEVPTIVQLWMSNDAKGPQVRVTPPGIDRPASRLLAAGRAEHCIESGRVRATVIHTSTSARGLAAAKGAPGSLVTLFIEPTCTPDRSGASAPSGDWRVSVTAASNTLVSVRVARSESAMGSRSGAHQPRLIDRAYDPERNVRPREDDPAPARAVPKGECIPTLRRNSISGAVTGAGAVAVAAYTLRPSKSASTYSSAGGHPAETTPTRPSPHYSAMGDESRALPGVRAAGSRSASVIRLTGTSFAAPQAARALLLPKRRLPNVEDPGRLGRETIDP